MRERLDAKRTARRDRQMEFIVLHFTFLMLLASILTSASCFSAFLASRRNLFLLAAIGFLFYFFDIAWVFQDSFVSAGRPWRTDGIYITVRSAATVISGVGFISSFWLLVCDYMGQERRVVKVAPCVAFLCMSIVSLFFPPTTGLGRFAFYSTRAIFLLWILLYAAFRYLRTDDRDERARMRRGLKIYIVTWLLGIGVVVEDACFFLVPHAEGIIMELRAVAPERNYCENALMICCMVTACKSAFKALSIRFDNPPMQSTRPQAAFVAENLPVFGKRYRLSPRELDVLALIIAGRDNQNIASSLQLSLSTVKVHVHNILKKTDCSDRRSLVREFWKES